MLKAKIDYESVRVIAFTVTNTENKKKHSVFYRKDKKEWNCNCTWNTLKETPCSHIKEAQKLLNETLLKGLSE